MSYKKTINYRLTHSLRERARKSIKNSPNLTVSQLIGCNIDHLKNHLEAQFNEQMNWDNYGSRGWHLDHIKPISKFDLNDPEQKLKCFHYSNIQPLWWDDNLKKSNKYVGTNN